MSNYTVAPLVGAWIEIGNTTTIASGIGSLPSWERGLKSKECWNHCRWKSRRSPRGSVD